VDAVSPAAVAGGNVETSQRIVDTLLHAFSKIVPDRIPAASSGTMNNVTIGGIDPRTGEAYAYYETIAGGSGGRPNGDGVSGVHTNMTNTMNTPVEALEYAYPFRVRRYSYRRGSGGKGKHCGGDGLVREIELLAAAQITLLTERRNFAPYGLHGGSPGQQGRNTLIQDGAENELPGKCNIQASGGAILRIETPGGGGWGKRVTRGSGERGEQIGSPDFRTAGR
jgi:N-methylhydantoinase B